MAFPGVAANVTSEIDRLLPLIGKIVVDEWTEDDGLVLTGIGVYADQVHCVMERAWGSLQSAIVVHNSTRIVERPDPAS